jgi:hypothetical protein
MSKKGAIELSLNFLVIIIVSMVILSGGLVIFFKLKASAQQTVEILDDQIQSQLKSLMLSNNYNVAVWPNQVEIAPKKSVLVGLGITSTLPNSQLFYMPGIPTLKIQYYPTPNSPAQSIAAINVVNPTLDQYSADNRTIRLTRKRGEENTPSNILANITPQQQSVFSILVAAPRTLNKGEYILTLYIRNTTRSNIVNNIDYGVTKLYMSVK